MGRKTLSDEELALFREATKGARRLVPDKVERPRANVGASPRQSEPATVSSASYPASPDDTAKAPIVGPEDDLFFVRTGLQRKAIRKLRRGDITIRAKLDLHGLRVAQARQALGRFVAQCQSNAHRHALIVHGKGDPAQGRGALKSEVDSWLRGCAEVVAFCSATPRDGGRGAVYVVIRATA